MLRSFSLSFVRFLALPLWALALGQGSPCQAQAAEHAMPAAQAAASAPAPVVTPLASTPPLDLPATADPAKPAKPPRHLTGVRLMPLPDSLRVILLLDGPAPYAVREQLAGQRVEVDLINTEIPYLPTDLAQTRDRRLLGIWLGRRVPGLGTLELRLPSSAMRVEHFTLSDPPAVVLDISRTDNAAQQLGGPGQSYPIAQPSVALPPASQPPAGRAAGSGGTPALGDHERAAAAAAVQLYLRPALPPEWTAVKASPAPHIQLPRVGQPAAAAPTSAPLRVEAPIPGGGTLVQHAESPEAVLVPLSEEFDGFPVHELTPATPEGKAVKEKFMLRRWPQVLADGGRLLQERPLGNEEAQILYMMAEARWQMGLARPVRPLAEMLNYYQQAHRINSQGDLGAYGALRIAQARQAMGDPSAALEDARTAQRTRQDAIGYRARLLQAQLLGETFKYQAALAQIAELRRLPLSNDRQVELELLVAKIQEAAGNNPEAWAAFERASKLDPTWMNLDRESCERLARVASATGRYEDARKWIEFINHNFSTRDEAANVKLLLLYADVMDHLGDRATAEGTYAVVLAKLGQSEKGRAVMEQLRRLYPESIVEGEQRYALLLLRQGRPQKAMGELVRAWKQCLRDGIDRHPLLPVIAQVVPAYMDQASRNLRPFEAVQAWREYGVLIEDPRARARCQPPLANALELSGLANEALKVLDDTARLDAAAAQAPEFLLQRARLLLALDRTPEALDLLEPLAAERQESGYHTEALRLLADAAERSHQPLKAAQALGLLAEASPTPADSAHALRQANDIYLQESMPLAAVDGALKGLMLEREALADDAHPWPPAQAVAAGNGFLKQLARGYEDAGDSARVRRVLEEWLARPTLSTDDRAEARYRLAQNALERGDRATTRQMLTAMTQDPQVPELWKRAAAQTAAQLDWNDAAPLWQIPQAAPAAADRQVQP